MNADRTWLLSPNDPPSRKAVLEAALELFVRHGMATTTIRMIGESAGYSNPALFKFFPGKDALALHLFERCYARLAARLAPAAASGSFGTALDATIDAFLDLAEQDLEAILFVQDSLRELWPRLPSDAKRPSILDIIGGLVARGIREGAILGFRSVDVPLAAMVGLFAQFARMIYFGEVEPPARRHREELHRALTRMLAT